MGLRAANKLRVRRAILDAAHELFVIKDYSQTTMEDVAAQASVAVGTLYNYFPSKSDLLLNLIAESDQKYIQAGRRLVDKPHSDPVKALTDIMVLATEHCVRQVGKSVWCQISATSLTNAESGFGIQYALTTKKHEELVEAMMCKLQERGDIAPDIDVGKASHLLFSMKSKLFLNFIASSSMPLSRHIKDVHEAVGYFVRGIGVPSPQKVIDRREKLLSRHVLSKAFTQ
jgi:AcrR family transcriptional regulator